MNDEDRIEDLKISLELYRLEKDQWKKLAMDFMEQVVDLSAELQRYKENEQ